MCRWTRIWLTTLTAALLFGCGGGGGEDGVEALPPAAEDISGQWAGVYSSPNSNGMQPVFVDASQDGSGAVVIYYTTDGSEHGKIVGTMTGTTLTGLTATGVNPALGDCVSTYQGSGSADGALSVSLTGSACGLPGAMSINVAPVGQLEGAWAQTTFKGYSAEFQPLPDGSFSGRAEYHPNSSAWVRCTLTGGPTSTPGLYSFDVSAAEGPNAPFLTSVDVLITAKGHAVLTFKLSTGTNSATVYHTPAFIPVVP